MIDQKTFNAQMGLLCAKSQRAADPAVIKMYKIILDEQLTTEQFVKGAIVTFAQDTFFPTPERIIEAALGEIQEAASAQWLEMLAAAKADRRTNLDGIAKDAIAELGGTNVVRTLSDHSQLMRVRTEFISNYSRRARAARLPKAQALPDSRAA
jgi:hypothetical protein